MANRFAYIFMIYIHIVTSVVGQNNSSDYRVVYDYTYYQDTINHKTKNDLFYLDIKSNESLFYSYYTEQSDSLRSTPEGRKKWRELFKAAVAKEGANTIAFPHKRSTFRVWKDQKTGKAVVADRLGNEKFLYQEEIKNIDWELQDSVKNIMNLQVQLAKGTYHGRTWNVWFTMDLPWQEGPWMLCGLPGLIVEAYDINCHHKFSILRIEERVLKDISFNTHEGKVVDRKEFLRKRRKYLVNLSNLVAITTCIDELAGKSELKYDFLETDYKQP